MLLLELPPFPSVKEPGERETVLLGCFACFIYVHINKIKCIQSENIQPENKAHILLLGLELAG